MKTIATLEPAYSVSDLSTHRWHVVARRERIDYRWAYEWEQSDMRVWRQLVAEGRAIVVQDQSDRVLVALELVRERLSRIPGPQGAKAGCRGH